jgi:hypothetical protein
VNGLRMQINEDRLRQPEQQILVGDLVDHYIQTELCEQTTWHSHATRIVYREFLTSWIRPHWGKMSICSVRTLAVERWLRSLQRANGNPLANTTKAKIRGLFSVLFNHAIRYEWLEQGRNPITVERVAADLLLWKETTRYGQPDDFSDLRLDVSRSILLATYWGLQDRSIAQTASFGRKGNIRSGQTRYCKKSSQDSQRSSRDPEPFATT